ncbi:hypothetical protein CDAR_460781 [Caerostris darwini]|uniref:Uncharacterized protein n=1 Tax=Caerostris darwini TaxID=1538125 RepID=A0AAV4PSC6_9ARAC|nr:hypothetical protein CDAR_460781 [Caerostris darwini]
MQTSTSMINGAQVMRRCCSLRILHRSFSGQECSHAVLTKADPGVEWEELGRERTSLGFFFHLIPIDFGISLRLILLFQLSGLSFAKDGCFY